VPHRLTLTFPPDPAGSRDQLNAIPTFEAFLTERYLPHVRATLRAHADYEAMCRLTKKTLNLFSPEVRQRAVRMVLDHSGDHASQWAAIGSIAGKIGCTAETLRKWVRQAEHDQGQRPGATSEERERIKALEREVRELRQANEILRPMRS
jgi:transposase-like protein